MNGANKSLVELLKRLDYSSFTLDLYILDFTDCSNESQSQIPDSVNIIKVPQYEMKMDILMKIIFHPIHFINAIVQKNCYFQKRWYCNGKLLQIGCQK